MALSRIRALLCAFTCACATFAAGQEYPPISAANLAQLQSQARIDFVELPGEPNIGWFESRADASEFIVLDRAGRIYRVSESGIEDSWTYAEPGSGQLFSLIDAAYFGDEPIVLYLLDDSYFIGEKKLGAVHEPLSLFAFGESLFMEALDATGRAVYMQFSQAAATGAWELVGEYPLPPNDPSMPAVRIGRIEFPFLLYSLLEAGALKVYRYPDAFAVDKGRDYSLPEGPAVFGALNAAGSHFAWSDPRSARLNLLDLETADNRVVAEIDGAYAQYHLLTADASAILIVNFDFKPEVFAWDVETGRRFELGPYRTCQRIPDKVALSADGTALVIGCDTGLDIWRVEDSENSEEG